MSLSKEARRKEGKSPRDLRLTDWEKLMSSADKGWMYPERPLLLNKNYPYKLLRANNPDEFVISVDDMTTALADAGIKAACERYHEYVRLAKLPPLDFQKLRRKNADHLPVAVKGPAGGFHRVEINSIGWNASVVYVTLVDKGTEKKVPFKNVYPPSPEFLRYPRLAMPCRLSQVACPEGTDRWLDTDYVKLFYGGKKHEFSIVSYDKGTFEVYLERDGVDVGYEMVMVTGLATNLPMYYSDTSASKAKEYALGKMLGKYPRYDFSPWVGQKLSVFGTKIVNVGKRLVKIHLQLDPTYANSVAEKVLAATQNIKDSLASGPCVTSFPKDVGDPVLAKFDGELYRGTIISKSNRGIVVKLVDYGDFVHLTDEDLLPLPKELLKYPEAATACYLVEMMPLVEEPSSELKEKLNEYVKEKDLICRIGYTEIYDKCDSSENRKCIVSLFVPDPNDPEVETPLAELLGLKCYEIGSYYPIKYPTVNRYLAPILLGGESKYFRGEQYGGVLSSFEDENNVWLQLEDDAQRAELLTDELTEYYEHEHEEDDPDSTPLEPSAAVVGLYVGAQQATCEPEDNRWYRAKITKACPKENAYTVLFLDYGNTDVVPIEKLKYLPNYFAKDNALAIQVALPIKLIKSDQSDELMNYVLGFTDGIHISVFLDNRDAMNYAWIYVDEYSLSHRIVNKKLGTFLVDPPLYPPESPRKRALL